MSFRSSDVSIKCRLIKCRSINCQFMKKYTNRNQNNSKTLQFTNCSTLQHTDTIENNLNTLHIRVYTQNSVNCSSSSSPSSSFEGYPLQVRHKQDWGRWFILLLPQTAAPPESDAGSGVIKPVSSSSFKTVRPRAPCGARCMGHAIRTWSAVCSEAPHSQFGEGARPHLCMDEWSRPTPVRRRLSLTEAARSKPIPTSLATVPGTKARSLEAFSQYSVFQL